MTTDQEVEIAKVLSLRDRVVREAEQEFGHLVQPLPSTTAEEFKTFLANQFKNMSPEKVKAAHLFRRWKIEQRINKDIERRGDNPTDLLLTGRLDLLPSELVNSKEFDSKLLEVMTVHGTSHDSFINRQTKHDPTSEIESPSENDSELEPTGTEEQPQEPHLEYSQIPKKRSTISVSHLQPAHWGPPPGPKEPILGSQESGQLSNDGISTPPPITQPNLPSKPVLSMTPPVAAEVVRVAKEAALGYAARIRAQLKERQAQRLKGESSSESPSTPSFSPKRSGEYLEGPANKQLRNMSADEEEDDDDYNPATDLPILLAKKNSQPQHSIKPFPIEPSTYANKASNSSEDDDEDYVPTLTSSKPYSSATNTPTVTIKIEPSEEPYNHLSSSGESGSSSEESSNNAPGSAMDSSSGSGSSSNSSSDESDEESDYEPEIISHPAVSTSVHTESQTHTVPAAVSASQTISSISPTRPPGAPPAAPLTAGMYTQPSQSTSNYGSSSSSSYPPSGPHGSSRHPYRNSKPRRQYQSVPHRIYQQHQQQQQQVQLQQLQLQHQQQASINDPHYNYQAPSYDMRNNRPPPPPPQQQQRYHHHNHNQSRHHHHNQQQVDHFTQQQQPYYQNAPQQMPPQHQVGWNGYGNNGPPAPSFPPPPPQQPQPRYANDRHLAHRQQVPHPPVSRNLEEVYGRPEYGDDTELSGYY